MRYMFVLVFLITSTLLYTQSIGTAIGIQVNAEGESEVMYSISTSYQKTLLDALTIRVKLSGIFTNYNDVHYSFSLGTETKRFINLFTVGYLDRTESYTLGYNILFKLTDRLHIETSCTTILKPLIATRSNILLTTGVNYKFFKT